MWIEDLIRALQMLGDIRYIDCIDHIKDDVIYMTSGTKYLVKDLVAEYQKKYGES